VIEFGSIKAAAIFACLRASRARASARIALRAARPHSAQALSRSEAGLPCFIESASGGQPNSSHAVTANAEIKGLIYSYILFAINVLCIQSNIFLLFIAVPDV